MANSGVKCIKALHSDGNSAALGRYDHPRIMRAEEETLPWSDVEWLLKQFEQACRNSDAHKVRELLLKAVNGFNPQCGVEDVLTKHRQGRDRNED